MMIYNINKKHIKIKKSLKSLKSKRINEKIKNIIKKQNSEKV